MNSHAGGPAPASAAFMGNLLVLVGDGVEVRLLNEILQGRLGHVLLPVAAPHLLEAVGVYDLHDLRAYEGDVIEDVGAGSWPTSSRLPLVWILGARRRSAAWFAADEARLLPRFYAPKVTLA